MNKKEMKDLFKQRWNLLFPNKRLLAIQLDGFTHCVYYDLKTPRAKVVKGECYKLVYSGCISQSEAIAYGMNDKKVVALFNGFPNYKYQRNAMEIIYVNP